MMKRIAEADMSHRFLALYLNEDKLYPHIRFSPPVYGESVSAPDGSDGRWYKDWPTAAKDRMVRNSEGSLPCIPGGFRGSRREAARGSPSAACGAPSSRRDTPPKALGDIAHGPGAKKRARPHPPL
jgi:hypothetical protein